MQTQVFPEHETHGDIYITLLGRHSDRQRQGHLPLYLTARLRDDSPDRAPGSVQFLDIAPHDVALYRCQARPAIPSCDRHCDLHASVKEGL